MTAGDKNSVVIGVVVLYFAIPGCTSLKEKRGVIKPLIHKLHKDFNLSVVEVDQQDFWRETTIGCAAISNSRVMIEKIFQSAITYCQTHFPDLELLDQHIEIF
jgi:hypothetical protein